jgi:hypothetical protein
MSTTQWVMSITQHNRGGGLQVNFKRLKLYHFPATRSVRVKWLLHELLGDDFDVEVVPLYDCAQYSPSPYTTVHSTVQNTWGKTRTTTSQV